MNKTKGSLWMVAAAFAGSLAQLIAARFYLHWLGAADFGTAVYCFAFVVFAMLVDLGFSRFVQTRIAALDPHTEKEEISGLCRMLGGLTLATSLFSIVVVIVAGQLLKLPNGEASPFLRLTLFLPVALQTASTIVLNSFVPLFLAANRYDTVATTNLARALLMAGGGLAATYWLRTPVALLWGTAIGVSVAAALAAAKALSLYGYRVFQPRIDRELLKEFVGFGVRSHAQRLSAVIAGGIDRLMIAPIVGGAELTWYAMSARVPEFLSDSLSPTYTATLSELARSSKSKDGAFEIALSRNVLIMAGIAAALVAVPSGLALGFLLVILGKSIPEVTPIAICFGLYKGLELVFNAYYMGLMARNKQERMSQAYLLNALLTIILCIPVAHRYGIVGVAIMNAAIQLCSFVVVLGIAKKWLMSSKAVSNQALRIILLMGCGTLLAWALAHFAAPIMLAHPWTTLIIAPIAALLAAAAAFGTKCAPLPSGVIRYVERYFQRR